MTNPISGRIAAYSSPELALHPSDKDVRLALHPFDSGLLAFGFQFQMTLAGMVSTVATRGIFGDVHLPVIGVS